MGRDKHSGNIVGGVGGAVDAMAENAIGKMVDEAVKTAVPGVGYSWCTDAETGSAVLVVVGRHPLGIAPVAVKIDPINALLMVQMVAQGIAQSLMARGAAMAKAAPDKEH